MPPLVDMIRFFLFCFFYLFFVTRHRKWDFFIVQLALKHKFSINLLFIWPKCVFKVFLLIRPDYGRCLLHALLCRPLNVWQRNQRGWKISRGCPSLLSSTSNWLCELHLDTTTVYLSKKSFFLLIEQPFKYISYSSRAKLSHLISVTESEVSSNNTSIV